MNLAALIGEVGSTIEPDGEGEAQFALVLAGRAGGEPQRLTVQVRGAQAAACRAYLRPGHRVAVEGRVASGARPAEILADRVQFLTTRAEAAGMEETAA